MIENHPDFPIEENHLAATIQEMKQVMTDLASDIDNRFTSMQQSLLIKDEVSAYVHAMLRGDHASKIQDIENALPSPYFGRVDFREDGTGAFQSYYIGRCKVTRLQINGPEDFLIFDWRDPVATVFYECYGGRASYEVLNKYHYEGDVRLKRQYKIEAGQLKNMVDNFILDQILSNQQEALLADPLLVDRLKEGAAEKLKDIVTSIQAEQNKIIREPLNQVTVIQGVAGSGKSTIGLHRLSYLLYREKLNPKKLIVIAPNRIFLDYISELLPEIDAADVTQLVWEDLVTAITGIKRPLSQADRLDTLLAAQDKSRIQNIEARARLKGSLDFQRILENYLAQKIQKYCLKFEDISLFEGKLTISAKDQLERFLSDAAVPCNERLRSLVNLVTFRVTNYLDVLAATHKKKGHDDKEMTQLRNKADAFLQKFGKRWHSLDLLETYQEIFTVKSAFKLVKEKNYDLEEIRHHTLTTLGAGELDREDLAPLAYLALLLDGWRQVDKYDHIVIDEAQDLNAFEFVVLKQLSTNGSFTIMGDLSQGIHSYRSIGSWNVLLKEVFGQDRTVYREILYSYRSAKEIVDLFNRVMPSGHSKAIPVYEIGRNPTAERIHSVAQGAASLMKRLSDLVQKGVKSIGIITKLESEATLLYEELKQQKCFSDLALPVHLITGEAASYQGAISLVPVSLAKGLEFDSVILWNASLESYKNTPLDSRLLYVALSRAMHDLHIMYQGTLTPLLRKKSDPT
ncbi:MAG: UvrD-helicase domain-containing protein [Sporomusaceae bacterium]|nr:UvrD-helicase domain-containing protein [Sporomusaceae bacterium]